MHLVNATGTSCALHNACTCRQNYACRRRQTMHAQQACCQCWFPPAVLCFHSYVDQSLLMRLFCLSCLWCINSSSIVSVTNIAAQYPQPRFGSSSATLCQRHTHVDQQLAGKPVCHTKYLHLPKPRWPFSLLTLRTQPLPSGMSFRRLWTLDTRWCSNLARTDK